MLLIPVNLLAKHVIMLTSKNIEVKIPSVINLATPAALSAVENKIPNVIDLF